MTLTNCYLPHGMLNCLDLAGIKYAISGEKSQASDMVIVDVEITGGVDLSTFFHAAVYYEMKRVYQPLKRVA